MELSYFIVDVFTRTPLEGNALAVVMHTGDLATAQMQAIAREFNLSETTFVERRPAAIEAAEGVRVRIFTTAEELPFAGHPTLGTASVLKLHAPDLQGRQTITLHLNVGPVPVRFTDDGLSGDCAYGTMTQRDPEFGAWLEPEDVARLTGLEPEDLDGALPPRVVSTGIAQAIVVLKSHAALARLKVNQQQATDWLRERGGRWFYVIAPERTSPSPPAAAASSSQPLCWRARMQFYGGEDPATGSAAGCAISYLVERGAVASGSQVHLRQGVEIHRPSDLYLSAKYDSEKVSEVRVGGSTVLVAKGTLFLP
jgi:trans-2,3-dihydro-3-hydroxyanthranilate isomerase